MAEEEDESNVAFIRKVLSALLRVVALFVVGTLHWALEKGIAHVVPENVPSAGLWLKDISFGVFSLIYIYLLWDLVKVFIPRLHVAAYPGQEKVEDDEAA